MSPYIRTRSIDVPLSAEELISFFKKCDKNGDGRLDKEELKEAFKRLGANVPGWRASRGLGHADANRDGFIATTDEEIKALVNYAVKHGFTIKPRSNGDGYNPIKSAVD